MPDVPKGFAVQVFAKGLKKPRVMRIAPNGDVFVAETESGRVLIFPAGATKRGPATPEVFADNLERPYGIVFHPPSAPKHVYVGAANQVVRYPYRSGARKPTGPAKVIIANIPTSRHWTRDLEVSRDGKRLFVSIGSASNVAGKMPDKSRAEIMAYEKTHGVGAAWGEEENRAVVRVFDREGKTVRNYATGLRNCSGMAIQPGTDALWCTGNERDHIGPNLAPDYLTTVKDGGFYGWPWYYIGGNEDPAHTGKRPDLKDKVIVPEVLIQAHSSTLDLIFYDADAFPAEYRGDAFATLHGSWNREGRTGYKVIRARMKNGKATGVYEDFMTGFVLDKNTVWGRPPASQSREMALCSSVTMPTAQCSASLTTLPDKLGSSCIRFWRAGTSPHAPSPREPHGAHACPQSIDETGVNAATLGMSALGTKLTWGGTLQNVRFRRQSRRRETGAVRPA